MLKQPFSYLLAKGHTQTEFSNTGMIYKTLECVKSSVNLYFKFKKTFTTLFSSIMQHIFNRIINAIKVGQDLTLFLPLTS